MSSRKIQIQKKLKKKKTRADRGANERKSFSLINIEVKQTEVQ